MNSDANRVHASDRLAFDLSMVAEPVWNRVDIAGEAISLAANVLLHAGPKFADTSKITNPIKNSACVAAVFEGLAHDFEHAERMIAEEELVLEPAQNYNVVVPLASVVSASMPLHSVYDAHRGKVRSFAPINGGNGPALRLGIRSRETLDHLRWLNGPFADTLRAGIAEGVELVPIAFKGVSLGDDCHGRTIESTRLLVEELCHRTPGGIQDDRIVGFMNNSPSLFLNLWMAATKCAMIAAEGVDGSGLVTAAGGNGADVGIQVSGIPGEWFTAPATAPQGETVSDVPRDRALGAIGDSAIVDVFGLGAMAVHLSPEQERVFRDFLPDDLKVRRERLPIAEHLGFRGLDVNFGVSARHVVEFRGGPVISLGILDKLGELGRLGGGIFDFPFEPFKSAMASIASQDN